MIQNKKLVNKIFTCYLSLGSNLGEREHFIKNAVNSLKKKIDIIKISSQYETEPVGAGTNPYINIVLKGKTDLTPYQMLYFIHTIEISLGRRRDQEVVWGDRTLDIDILLYENFMISDYRLTIPHKQMLKRIFVMEPFAEISPNFLIKSIKVSEHLFRLKDENPYYDITKIGELKLT
ncbi:2-amino-4-hydroxy-6-hydroxymethyldihydropteridine diphosphokinase [bacterium]|nr:2-amino-4-hydroxy-6-hydroxymethyldihydropteridine diphosphokinase [bacterium]